MGDKTQSSLISVVFAREEETLNLSLGSLKDHFLILDDLLRPGVTIDMAWVQSVLADNSVIQDVSIRNTLGTSTILRLLRFLPDHFIDQWLLKLFHLSSQSLDALEALSSCLDWQPSLFQFLSELVEKIAGSARQGQSSNDITSPHEDKGRLLPLSPQLPSDIMERRLYLALELYSSLLGHRLREGGEQVRNRVI